MTPHELSRVPRILSSPHLWLVVALFVIGIILHYPQQILSTDAPSLFSVLGLTRHAMERIFFLLPITYAAFFLGRTAGLTSLTIALAIMLPRAILLSTSLSDALFETGVVILIAGLVNLWFEGYRKEQKQHQQFLQKLESAQQELKSHVLMIESNEKRLAAINTICAAISQSLELEDVINIAADKVRELMSIEVTLVFFLDEEKQELVLKAYQGVPEEFAAGLKGLKVGEGFNGWVAQTGEPLLIEDASRDPRLTREVVKRENIQAGFIVPMKAKGKVVGTLWVAKRGARQFLDEEVELLTTIGRQIGIAVENARLYQKEHTLVEHIARDVIKEKQMQDSLRFYLRQVTRAQEEERKRIARELHDDTAQELVALSRRLDRFISSTPKLSAQNISYLEELQQQTDKILDGVRRFSQDLRPSILDDLGLVPALEWLISDLSNYSGIAIGIGLFGSTHRFHPETELVLFRIAQEALRNVCKHSEASRAWVTLEFGDGKVTLTVRDNGKGFKLPDKIGDLANTGKLGLAGMQERAKLIGGELTIQSEPGEGTNLIAEVPI